MLSTITAYTLFSLWNLAYERLISVDEHIQKNINFHVLWHRSIFLFCQHIYHVCVHTHAHIVSILFKPSTAQKTTDNAQVNKSTIFFLLWPFYDLMLCLFSPGWYFKTSSKSRLTNSMVAKDCLCSLLKLFICYYLLFLSCSGLLHGGEVETSSNLFSPLAFSSKSVFPSTARLYPQLLQSCTLWVNFSPTNLFSASLRSFPSPSLPSLLSFPSSSLQQIL